MRSVQAPGAVVMIRPHRFHPNLETAADNAFQRHGGEAGASTIAHAARDEVTAAAVALEEAGVRVHVFDDFGERETPDSVFPNNWFSTHRSGHVALYPMALPSRRRERRADPVALERFCTHFNFEPTAFTTADAQGAPIYHTNVMMSVATAFALVGFELMNDANRRDELRARLEESGRDVIALDARQIGEFAGNALELSGSGGRVLALSARAEPASLRTSAGTPAAGAPPRRAAPAAPSARRRRPSGSPASAYRRASASRRARPVIATRPNRCARR
ncbi:MAG: arginine deiminase-related protein [Pseudomonadota bacterium]